MDFTSGGRQDTDSDHTTTDRVPLIRIEPEERLYDREAYFGRDVTSVFPNEAAPEDPSGNFKEALGAVKFVTETELETIRKGRGDRVEDGTVESLKSLAETLADNKQAKEDEFQATWKQMKTGKNRPLDEEEIEFFDELIEREKHTESTRKEEEEDALLSFQVAKADMENMVTKEAAPLKLPSAMLNPAPLQKRKQPPKLAGMVRVKAASKKPKLEESTPVEETSAGADADGVGLGGLLGYASSDEDEET